jgi:hypothetical protein
VCFNGPSFRREKTIDVAGWITSERHRVTGPGIGRRIVQNWILLECEYKDGIRIKLSRYIGVHRD